MPFMFLVFAGVAHTMKLRSTNLLFLQLWLLLRSLSLLLLLPFLRWSLCLGGQLSFGFRNRLVRFFPRRFVERRLVVLVVDLLEIFSAACGVFFEILSAAGLVSSASTNR